jgi:5-methylcytosine-specific restriction endonuclease McrBC regulatory subunit McrC
MLQKVFSINVLDFKISTQPEAIWDIFLIYLFPNALHNALNQGLYKAYQRNQYNNAQVKGTIPIARHLRQNLPFMGNIAYDVREHTYDNPITQLIRHTIEYIKSHKITNAILNRSHELRAMAQQIEGATPTYRQQQRATIMTQNLKPVNHPFFTEYEFLRKLCLQILRREGISLAKDNPNKVYGIVFDGAWLWEEYLNTILLERGFTHPRNKEQKDAVFIFQDARNHPRYPDFYRPNDIVLDAKYKWEPNSEDINKIITYMYILKTTLGGFIYPNQEHTQKQLLGNLNGHGGQLHNYPFLIPQNLKNWSDFIQMMRKEEQNLSKIIEELDQLILVTN